MSEYSVDNLSLAVTHPLTLGAVRVALEKVKGRVGKKPHPLDESAVSVFMAFARTVTDIVRADDSVDLSYVTSQEQGWRTRLANENEVRLRDLYAVEAVIARFTSEFEVKLPALAPPDGVTRDALRSLLNIVTQVARMMQVGMDPMLLHVSREPASQERPSVES